MVKKNYTIYTYSGVNEISSTEKSYYYTSPISEAYNGGRGEPTSTSSPLTYAHILTTPTHTHTQYI